MGTKGIQNWFKKTGHKINEGNSPVRREMEIRGNTQVPYFPPHREIIFSSLFRANFLGNRAEDKNLKENKSTRKSEKERARESARETSAAVSTSSP